MTEPKIAPAQPFAAGGKHEARQPRIGGHPRLVPDELALAVLDDLDVKVVENADDGVHITRSAPPTRNMDRSNDGLTNASGKAQEGTRVAALADRLADWERPRFRISSTSIVRAPERNRCPARGTSGDGLARSFGSGRSALEPISVGSSFGRPSST